jgi:hypothetical protein
MNLTPRNTLILLLTAATCTLFLMVHYLRQGGFI